ncbi:hypothetical protein LguiA_035745 [Lonicera macranthoides]
MDLESECSALESVEDNDVITPETLLNVSGTNIEKNGHCRVEHDDNLRVEMKEDGDDEVTESVNSSPLTVQSPEGSIGSSTPSAAKGYGLRKWRRIRRDASQEGGSNADSSKILKRGLSISSQNLRKAVGSIGLSDDGTQVTEALVTIMKAVAKKAVVTSNNLAVGPSSAAENREDHGSNSSTAGSAPRLSYDAPAMVENAWDHKNKIRSLSGKNLGNSFQRVQQHGRGKLETSKKPRGERVKIEKENSHSSLESDSRSLNFVFMQAANSGTGNGRQSTKYDGENSDEAQGGEERGCSFRENVLQEDLGAELSWEIKEEKSENHGSSTDRDSLGDSISMLESAQEALEKEIQKLREIGSENTLAFNDSELNSADPKVDEPSSSDLFQLGEIRPNSPQYLESQMINLNQNVNILESKLEEAKATLEVKETEVIELEATLNSRRSPQKSAGLNMELQKEEDREIVTELESLFKQKIEAEVEYLAISRTIQNLRVAAVDQITLLEERKALAAEQAQMVNKLEDAKSKATMLKRRAEMLEMSCGDIIETDEVLKLQKRVCKFTSCFFIQLILLVVVVGLFVLQLSPRYEEVVPT